MKQETPCKTLTPKNHDKYTKIGEEYFCNYLEPEDKPKNLELVQKLLTASMFIKDGSVDIVSQKCYLSTFLKKRDLAVFFDFVIKEASETLKFYRKIGEAKK